MAAKGVNWDIVRFSELYDSLLAKDIKEQQGIDVSREMVRQKRVQLKKPKVSVKGFLATPAQDRIKAIGDDKLKTMYITEICRIAGVSDTVVRTYLKDNNIKLRRGVEVYPFDEWNWDLPNKTLEEIWGAHPNTAATRRNTHQLPTAKWNLRFGRYPKDDPEFEAAVKAEKKKAEGHEDLISRTRQRMRTNRKKTENTVTA